MLKGEGDSDEQQAVIRIFKFASHFLKNRPQFMLLSTQDSKSLLLLLESITMTPVDYESFSGLKFI
jgi:hypothetical protein